MDPIQIPSLASSLDSYQLSNQSTRWCWKKALDSQQSIATDLIKQILQLPSNPAIGRNINTTA
ncbi:putative motility protein [Enterobacter sp. EA-1]|nr:putative motility protein [Enterobacter sp. EA-1]